MKVERRIGFFLSAIGVVSVTSLTARLLFAGRAMQEIIGNPSIFVVTIAVVYLSILSFLNSEGAARLNGLSQFFIFILFGSITLLQVYDSWYGIGSLSLAFLVGYKYRYYEKRRGLKITLSVVYVFAIVQIGAVLSNIGDLPAYGVEAILYLAFFFGVLFFCFVDEVSLNSSKVDRLKKEKAKLEEDVRKRAERIEQLNIELQQLGEIVSPLDISDRGISPAELKVLECLVKTRGSNVEIGQCLGKSHETVKIQIGHLMDKVGAEDRFHLIELCQYNFDGRVAKK